MDPSPLHGVPTDYTFPARLKPTWISSVPGDAYACEGQRAYLQQPSPAQDATYGSGGMDTGYAGPLKDLSKLIRFYVRGGVTDAATGATGVFGARGGLVVALSVGLHAPQP